MVTGERAVPSGVSQAHEKAAGLSQPDRIHQLNRFMMPILTLLVLAGGVGVILNPSSTDDVNTSNQLATTLNSPQPVLVDPDYYFDTSVFDMNLSPSDSENSAASNMNLMPLPTPPGITNEEIMGLGEKETLKTAFDGAFLHYRNGFRFTYPDQSNFSQEEQSNITYLVEQTTPLYEKRFGPCTNPHVTAIVKKPIDSPYPYHAYYYGAGVLSEYPGGVFFLDLDEINNIAAESRGYDFYVVACEVAHAWSVPDLPFESLVEDQPIADTTGIERDEFVMAEMVRCANSDICLADGTAPIYKIMDRYPTFYRELRDKWEQAGRPDFVPEKTWVSWANALWSDFADWWEQREGMDIIKLTPLAD